MARNRIQKSLFVLLLAIMILAGCDALNPFCRSARPKPGLTSLAPDYASLSISECVAITCSHKAVYALLSGRMQRVSRNPAHCRKSVPSDRQCPC
jgi:uncharacterized lipoprotein YajG